MHHIHKDYELYKQLMCISKNIEFFRKNDQRQQIKWETESLVEDIPSKLCGKNPKSQKFANLASNSFMNIFGSEMTTLLVRTLCYYLQINFSFLLHLKIVVSKKQSPWRKKTWYPLFQTMTDLPPLTVKHALLQRMFQLTRLQNLSNKWIRNRFHEYGKEHASASYKNLYPDLIIF